MLTTWQQASHTTAGACICVGQHPHSPAPALASTRHRRLPQASRHRSPCALVQCCSPPPLLATGTAVAPHRPQGLAASTRFPAIPLYPTPPPNHADSWLVLLACCAQHACPNITNLPHHQLTYLAQSLLQRAGASHTGQHTQLMASHGRSSDNPSGIQEQGITFAVTIMAILYSPGTPLRCRRMLLMLPRSTCTARWSYHGQCPDAFGPGFHGSMQHAPTSPLCAACSRAQLAMRWSSCSQHCPCHPTKTAGPHHHSAVDWAQFLSDKSLQI